MQFIRELIDIQRQFRQIVFPEKLARMNGRRPAISLRGYAHKMTSVIIHYLNLMRLLIAPYKANSILLIDANAMLARSGTA